VLPGETVLLEVELESFKEALPRFPSPEELAVNKQKREQEEQQRHEENPPPTLAEKVASSNEEKEQVRRRARGGRRRISARSRTVPAPCHVPAPPFPSHAGGRGG
jgi:hypothetical protein